LIRSGKRFGEIVDVNLVRDQKTGRSKGFAFIAYEDQRSSVLSVDNFNGAKILGRMIRVDHVGQYKHKKPGKKDEDKKTPEDEEFERMKAQALSLDPTTMHENFKKTYGIENKEAPLKGSQSLLASNEDEDPLLVCCKCARKD